MVLNVAISIKAKSVKYSLNIFMLSRQMFLGNCWFIAAANALALHPDLHERTVPPNQSFDDYDYAGMNFVTTRRRKIVMRYWQFFSPRNISFSVLGIWLLV